MIKGIKLKDNQIRFVFPRSIDFLRSPLTPKQIKTAFLAKWKQHSKVLPNFPYQRIVSDTGFSYQCTMCSSLINFINAPNTPNKFQLNAISFEHVHDLNFDNFQIPSNNKVQVYEANCFNGLDRKIKNTIDSLETNSIEAIKKFDHKIGKQVPNGFQELMKYLDKIEAFKSYEPVDYKKSGKKYPDFMIIITKEMKKLYLKAARSVGFDFTYSLIRETTLSSEGRTEYGIGFIAGLNSYRRICCYALIVATKENKQFTEKAFSEFILYMGKEPESIVTDQSLGLLTGLNEIKNKGVYQGVTLLDTFHILKNYKFHNRQLKRHIMKMVREKCKHKFHCMYLEAIQMARTEEEMDAVHHFMHESAKFCISQIPSVFVGLGVSNAQNQSINHLIKLQLKIEVSYSKAVFAILEIVSERNTVSNILVKGTTRIKDFQSGKQLHVLNGSVCTRVFQFFRRQMSRSCNIDITHKEDDFFCVQDEHSVHYVTRIPAQKCGWFVRNKKTQHITHCFECTCKFQEKTGIPCEHIIKALWETHNSFVDIFDDYWLVQFPDKLLRCYVSVSQENYGLVKPKGHILGKQIAYLDTEGMDEIKLPKGASTIENKRGGSKYMRGKKVDRIENDEQYGKEMERSTQNTQEKDKKNRIESMNNYFANDDF